MFVVSIIEHIGIKIKIVEKLLSLIVSIDEIDIKLMKLGVIT